MPLSARQLIAGVAAGDTEAVRELVARVLALEETAQRVEQLEAGDRRSTPEIVRPQNLAESSRYGPQSVLWYVSSCGGVGGGGHAAGEGGLHLAPGRGVRVM